ncbi:MAG: carbohydrate-binding family 9-like protein [Sedimentisphaerales bacterium]|nr:carbohydrate-binding family 9-like protein [Sedimentisphaerales bacterium]
MSNANIGRKAGAGNISLKRQFVSVIILVVWFTGGCAVSVPKGKVFRVNYEDAGSVVIDGQLSEAVWAEASLTKDFFFPWENTIAAVTEFRSFCDGRTLYFSFLVYDTDIVTVENFDSERKVSFEDRVEIFLACDDSMKNYYCLEIDPLGRVNDYRASYYRKFDHGWTCPGLITAASIFEKGYIVEAALPIETLEALGLMNNAPDGWIRTGLFRAEFKSTGGPKPEEHWMSWVDPATTEPDFHVPSAMGVFCLEKQTDIE